MANLGNHFAFNFDGVKSNKNVIFAGSNYRITILSERLLRFEYSKNGIFLDAPTNFALNRNFPESLFKAEETPKDLFINTKYFSLQYSKNKPFKGPTFAPDSNLRVKLNGTDKLWYPTHPEARNFKSISFSLDEFKKIKLEKGLYSTDGFVMIDDSEGLVIDEKGSLSERFDGNQDFYLFMYRRDFGYCLKDYFNLTGNPALIPRYALGIWWNRDRIYSADDTKKIIQLFNRYEIPISVFLLSEFWHAKDLNNLSKSGYSFNENLFPNVGEYMEYMHKRGVRIGINLDPADGIKLKDPVYPKFATELQIKNGEEIPFKVFDKIFMMVFVKEVIDNLMSFNLDFFWIDYQKNIKELEALNYYIFNNYKKSDERRGMILSRNALAAAHRYPVLYSGQTIASWDTLKYLPFYNSNASNIGVSWLSHDVGGFKDGIEDSELYLRYVQFSVFNPIFRFSAKRGQYYKREPWLWDIKTYTIVKSYCNFRHQLIPYLYSENYKYHKTGLPIVQPLYYILPEIYDEPIYKNEYFFGSELLIAPITKPKDIVMNRSIERIYLPKGTWYDFKTGKKFLGNKRYILFYTDEDYPVFVKAGGIIPIAVLDTNRNDTGNPKKLEINVFPGESNVYKLYEDDGISRLHEEGYYIITAIDYNYMANNYTLIIHPFEGKTGIIPKTRDYTVKFRNTKEAKDVTIYVNADVASNKMETYTDDTDFWITIYDVDTTKQLTINCKGRNIEIDASRIFNEDINSIISDLKITTKLKESIAEIMFSDRDIKRKRILIRKLKREGLAPKFVTMFLKLLEYSVEI